MTTNEARAEMIRCDRQEPAGDIYFARLAAHGGREYRGGPVCWDPQTRCEGVCRDCPRPLPDADEETA